MDIGTTRKNTTLSGGVVINSQLNYTFDYNHLDQSGAKLMGFGVAGVGGASGETISILPMPTNYKTDTFNVAMNWRQDDAYATMSLYSSVFRDGYNSVSFQNWSGTSTSTQLMPTAPDNSFNQVNVSGGYKLSPQTKLAANFSYGGGTQNVPFVSTNGLLLNTGIPSSLNGSIINTHADVKLTNQTNSDLLMSVAYKYDQRNNQTTSNLYNFNAISGQHPVNYPNTPLSTRKEQLEVAGDYRLKQDQHLRMSVSHENYERWCNNFASGGGTAYTATTNCVVAKSSADDKIDATYRIKTNEDTHVRMGVGYSDRKTVSDPYALQDFLSQNGAVPGPVPATGNTTPKGQNAGDYYGFYPVFSASRQQQYVKASVNWQATEQLELGVSGRYTDDKYPDSTYGVQNGKSWSLNLDATYNYRENGSLNAYVSQQSRQRDMTNLQRYSTTASAASATAVNIPAVATWTNKLTDEDLTVGLGFKQGGLMAGKFELAGDLSYSLGNAGYNTQLNYTNATTVATGSKTCSDPTILSCGQLPDIRTSTTRLKLTGTYQVDKSSKVVLVYLQQRMSMSDYFYNGYQLGSNPTNMMPTNQTSGSYSANAFGASFIHNF
jgi:MtrB/PioB family decaheme-associated outer membrane protein